MLIVGHVLSLIGSVLVLASFAGLGRIVQRTFGEQGAIYEAIALGFAVNLIIGGLLNLLGAISLATVITIEAAGLLAFFLDRRQLIYEIKKYPKQLYPFLVISVFYLLSVTNGVFNWQDDFNGYLIPVEKIIQTHRLGSDPFLIERLSGLSHFYAQAFYALQFGYEHLSLFDPGLGRIIIGLLLIERLAKYFSTYPAIALALLTSGLLVAWTWNTAAPVAILTAFLTLLTFEVLEQKSRPVHFGLLGAAAISLKVTAAPYVGLLGAIWLLSIARGHGIRYAARTTIFAGFAGAATLLPWMISLYLSSRTLMYPILGQGYNALGPVYSFFSWHALWHNILTLAQVHFVIGIVLIISGAIVLIAKSKRQTRWLITSIAVSMTASMLLIIYSAGGGFESFRYVQPVCVSFGIVALVMFINEDIPKSNVAKNVFAVLALVTAMAMIPPRAFLTINAKNIVAILSGREPKLLEVLFSHRDALRQAQQLAPEHERILALTDYAMMLDFARNPVWPTGNYPGVSSPPPGISKLQTPSELRRYLLRLGIAYVLFEPHMEVISGDEARLATPAETYLAGPWDYSEMIISVRAYQNIARLAETSEVQSLNGYEMIKLTSQ
jgi:hypothetical protein